MQDMVLPIGCVVGNTNTNTIYFSNIFGRHPIFDTYKTITCEKVFILDLIHLEANKPFCFCELRGFSFFGLQKNHRREQPNCLNIRLKFEPLKSNRKAALIATRQLLNSCRPVRSRRVTFLSAFLDTSNNHVHEAKRVSSGFIPIKYMWQVIYADSKRVLIDANFAFLMAMYVC